MPAVLPVLLILPVLPIPTTMTIPKNTFSLPLGGQSLAAARFLSGLNRFLVFCEGEACGRVKAFLPNPGRLLELLLPDVTLYLLHNGGGKSDRATDYTVLAVERDGQPVLLHTHWCNVMARQLLDAGLVPGLENARVVRQEVKVGHSRFDFLLEDNRGPLYVEVKSCTLFGNNVAMFPDAVTARGRRHLLELHEIAESGKARCAVLFMVQTDQAACFMPDYHTDPEFADAMLAVRQHVPIIPLPMVWDKRLNFTVAGKPLPIPWDYVKTENKDRGAYLLLLELKKKHTIPVGSLGTLSFNPGWYIYVGSAMHGLKARLARHTRKRKNKHWHIDSLRDVADTVECLPIRASKRLECDLSKTLTNHCPESVPNFGCTDCKCPSHLFYQENSPLHQSWFHEALQHFRMNTPIH